MKLTEPVLSMCLILLETGVEKIKKLTFPRKSKSLAPMCRVVADAVPWLEP